ncbi:hypothetical protein A0H81_03490 [Grifola frondosa]|uniref:Protein-S-isoprenylcysteine O-methyltransferase n=1 Tax=Grifola frondosa TaxID=5627 RepID=A0A1C7MHW3_GRIFR|nr:hypothetical protein A0H81_03490 [Grifola frondosa]
MLLFALYCTYVSANPPHPPPKDAEAARYKDEKKTSRRIFKIGAPMLRYGSALVYLGEVAVLLAQHYHAHPLSRPVLSLLLRGAPSAASHIRITRPFLLGFLLLLLGTSIRVACYRHLGRLFTFELALRDDHKLVTSGPYSIVRHPAYTGLILAMAGIALIHLGPGSWWDALGCGGAAGDGVWAGVGGDSELLYGGVGGEGWEGGWGVEGGIWGEWERWAGVTPYRLVPGIW